MTNYEWLVKENAGSIKKHLLVGGGVAVRYDGSVGGCGYNTRCSECIFNKDTGCDAAMKEWFEEEHNPYTVPLDTTIDTKVLVSADGEQWVPRHFAGFSTDKEYPYLAFLEGRTSWSNGTKRPSAWKYCKLEEEKND